MKIEGRHSIAVPREALWQAVLDPDVLARTLPGCKKLEAVGENSFEGILNIKVGPVQGQFKGLVTLSDLVEPESYRMSIKGKGAPGFVDGEGALRLEPDGDGTALVYEIDAKVGGRIAGVGQRLLDSSAKVIARQTLEGLEKQVIARHQASQPAATSDAAPADSEEPGDEGAAPASEPPVEPDAMPEGPSQAEFAAEFTKGLLGELIPPERRPLVITVALAILALIIFLLVRTC